MAETKRMAEQANKMGQDAFEQAKRIGEETAAQGRRAGEQLQNAAQTGFEAASRSVEEVNRGFQAIAAEMANYSRKTLEDVFQAWEQLLRARTAGDMMDVQTRYAKKAYDTHVAELSRLTELYQELARNAVKPVEDTARRSVSRR